MSCLLKIQIGLTILVLASTQFVVEERLIDGCLSVCSYVAGAVPAASTFNPSAMSQPYMSLHPQPSQLPPQSIYNGSNVPHQQMM